MIEPQRREGAEKRKTIFRMSFEIIIQIQIH